MHHPRSPILTLETALAGAAYRIAPEREIELATDSSLKTTSIVIDEGKDFTFHVSPSSKEITTTVATLEYLWCSAHAQIVLYDEYAKAQRRGEKNFDAGANPRRRTAIDLLNWSISNLTSSDITPWPRSFPQPQRYPPEGTDIHVANELFLCATAWIIHHELAHLRLSHQPFQSIRSKDEEKEADLEATKWILQKSSVPNESSKRAAGIATALLALQTISSTSHVGVFSTHPATYERIYYCLDNSGLANDHEVFAFSACVMQINLATHGFNFAPDASSYRELLNEYLVAHARL